MNLALFGPPGCGKGTQSEKLVAKFGFVHVSTGDLLRAEIKCGSKLGQTLEGIVKRGELVADSLMIALLAQHLNQLSGRAILLDGFPRTEAQARALEALVSIDRAVLLTASLDVVTDRMVGRLICMACGATYHRQYAPAQREGQCDRCASVLTVRPDDQPETICKRYNLYNTQTQGALSFYQNLGKMVQLDGALDPDQVFQSICQALDRFKVRV